MSPTSRFSAIVLGAAAIAAALGPLPVDRRPPLEQPYGRETLAAARALAGRVDAEVRDSRGSLEAGFGVAQIAIPARGVALAGYGARAKDRSTSVRDPVKARAIALSRGGSAPLLVLGADILLVNERLAAAVVARLGIPRERVLFTATHTHAGPGGFGTTLGERVALGPFDEEVARAIEDALVAAAKQALYHRAPARLGGLEPIDLSVPEYVRDRYWEGRRGFLPPVDDDLRVVRIVRDDGKRAMIASYGAHATVVGAGGRFVSGDYPGAFSRAFEEAAGAFHAEVVIFAAGPVGSQAPEPPAGDDEGARADAMGRALANRYLSTSGWAELDREPALGGSGLSIRLPPLQPRLGPDFRVTPWLAHTQSNDRGHLTVFRLGREVLIGLPGELSGELSLELKTRVAAGTGGLRAWPLPFNGDYAGYVLADAHYGRWEYENQMSFHGPHFGSYLVTLAATAAGAGAEGAPPPR